MYLYEQIPNRKQTKYRILDPQGAVYLSELSLKKANRYVLFLNDLFQCVQQPKSEGTNAGRPPHHDSIESRDLERFFAEEERYYRESRAAIASERARAARAARAEFDRAIAAARAEFERASAAANSEFERANSAALAEARATDARARARSEGIKDINEGAKT